MLQHLSAALSVSRMNVCPSRSICLAASGQVGTESAEACAPPQHVAVAGGRPYSVKTLSQGSPDQNADCQMSWLQLEVTTAFGDCLRFDLQDTTHGALVSAQDSRAIMGWGQQSVTALKSCFHMHTSLHLQALSVA